MQRQSIFNPVEWRGRRIPSRVVMAPINTGFARNYRPAFDLLRFHRDRSGPSIGISIVGNVAVNEPAAVNRQTAVLQTCSDVGRFAVIARAIHDRGSLAGIQLAFAPSGLSPSKLWRARQREAEILRLRNLILALEPEFLETTLVEFINSAALAIKAGFDLVQIHAAHGYLLSLLLNPITNVRQDSFSSDSPWLEKFIQDLRLACGGLISFRVSMESGLTNCSEETAATRSLLIRMAQNEVDLLDLSSGFYTVDRHLIYPKMNDGSMPLYEMAREVATRLNCLVSFAGNILDFRNLPEDTPVNLLCSVGRALIADAEFAKKASEGRYQEIVSCQRTGHCHYFTRGKTYIECGVNRNLSREGDRR